MLLDHALNILTIGVWILLAFFILLYLLRTTLVFGFGVAVQRLFSTRMLYVLLAFAVALVFLNNSLVFIEPQDVGVVISMTSSQGYRSRPFRSGLHWIVPFMEEVYLYPISWQTYTMSATPIEGANQGNDSIAARTSDGQAVFIDCSVIFQIDPEQAPRIYIDWQDRYISDFIRPLLRGLIRTLVSQYTVDEVNSSKRMDLERDLASQVQAALEDKGFIMDHFLLRNITFSQEYADAVELKQVALQGSIQKQYEAEQLRNLAMGQADATKLNADAEAYAIKLLGQALQDNPDVITLRYVDKLAPGIQVMLVPNNAPYLLTLPTLQPNTTPSVPLPTGTVYTPTAATPPPTATPTSTPTP
jgi:regulator of protease activity HflC (stomatin/prohibitin superfamily)